MEITSEKTTLVNFYATWCRPFQFMKLNLEVVANKYGTQIDFYRIDVDQQPDLAEQFQIRSVPATFIFKHNEVKWKQARLVPAGEIIKVMEGIKKMKLI